jgi:hypothetical protein
VRLRRGKTVASLPISQYVSHEFCNECIQVRDVLLACDCLFRLPAISTIEFRLRTPHHILVRHRGCALFPNALE